MLHGIPHYPGDVGFFFHFLSALFKLEITWQLFGKVLLNKAVNIFIIIY